MSEQEDRPIAVNDESPDDARLLRGLIDELRAAPPPELDWDRVERGLVGRLEADVLERRRARGRRWAASVLVAAAAAAVLVLSLGNFFDAAPSAQPGHSADLATVPQVDGAYRVGALAPATAIESGDQPIRFTLPGVVSWTLAPQSRVVVDTVAAPHRLTLERGRIDAEVVPMTGAPAEAGRESFAIIAGTTRVAVRGTIFSVARDESVVTVEVTRGKVAVGAVERHDDPVELLVGPARAQFSLAGARLASRHAEASPPATPRDETPVDAPTDRAPGAEHGAPHRPDASIHTPEAPPSATAPDTGSSAPPAVEPPAEISVAQARAIVLGCLRQALASASGEGPELTVSSAVTVTLGPAGRVDAVRFTPPLRPDLQQRCGGALFGQKIDAEGKASFHVAVSR